MVMSWNCCGLGNPRTVQRLIALNKKFSPDIIFIQETKNPDAFVLKDLEPLLLEFHFLVSPNSPSSGGLCLLWKSDVKVQVLTATPNYIDTHISYKNSNFFSSFVYGALEVSHRQEVWDQLTQLGGSRSDPWLMTGDFNEITDNSEKTGGRDRPESSFSNFRTFLAPNDLFDLRHRGNFLSWRGTRHTHRVHCRLDQALANISWSDCFPKGNCVYLPFEGSDHRPLISSFTATGKKRPYSFCYDRRLRHNEEVRALVGKVLSESRDCPVSTKIANCISAIASWSKKHHINS